MDEIEMLRALRPEFSYPEDKRQAARALLLAEPAAHGPQASPRRARRWSRRPGFGWSAAAAAVALGAVAAVVAIQGGGGAGPGHVPAQGTVGAGQALLLAAHTALAEGTSVPAGARWQVRELMTTSSAWSGGPRCGLSASTSTSLGDVTKAVRGSTPCRANPPGSIPKLRGAKLVPNPPVVRPGKLPSQPKALLAEICRQLQSEPGDSLPGKPPPRVSAADMNEMAFQDLRVILESGISPAFQAVVYEAMAKIPSVTITSDVRDIAGQAGVAISVLGSEDKEAIILAPGTYQLIGGVMTSDTPGTPAVTIQDAVVWHAYYDADGNKV